MRRERIFVVAATLEKSVQVQFSGTGHKQENGERWA